MYRETKTTLYTFTFNILFYVENLTQKKKHISQLKRLLINKINEFHLIIFLPMYQSTFPGASVLRE